MFISAVARIRTWVVSVTTKSTNHYTMTAIAETAQVWILVTAEINLSLWCGRSATFAEKNAANAQLNITLALYWSDVGLESLTVDQQ